MDFVAKTKDGDLIYFFKSTICYLIDCGRPGENRVLIGTSDGNVHDVVGLKKNKENKGDNLFQTMTKNRVMQRDTYKKQGATCHT